MAQILESSPLLRWGNLLGTKLHLASVMYFCAIYGIAFRISKGKPMLLMVGTLA
jgi:hypothetical protein